MVVESLASDAGAGLGESVGVEHERVAGRKVQVTGDEVGLSGDADGLSADGVCVQRTSVAADEQRR